MAARREREVGEGMNHSPDCDVLDVNPEGIKKPCNCLAGEAALLEFARRYRCVYMGATLCSSCYRRVGDDGDSCDMAAVREIKQEAFIAGWAYGDASSGNEAERLQRRRMAARRMEARRSVNDTEPRGPAEVYVQHERWMAPRWRVMFRIGDALFAIGSECDTRSAADRLRADFENALTEIGVALPNNKPCVKEPNGGTTKKESW
jgi:hypothetical protein